MIEKLKLLKDSLGRLFFGLVILIAILAIVESAPQEYRDGEWFDFVISVGLALTIAWDYLTDWAHKIK